MALGIMGRKPEGKLRRGWTTGACATAATRAAYTALLTGAFPDPVTIALPRGQRPAFALAEKRVEGGAAIAAIIKDAGDDPDVTHGALVRVTVRRNEPGSGVTFRAGEGVGTVTRPGLSLPVGDPAINPVPRRMMRDVVAELAVEHGDPGDIEIRVSIPGGEALAQKTLNPRLGIVGGLSILGTTGVVIPYSCSSWIHSIHQGIDVARAAGLTHIAAATGSVSERAVQDLYGLPDTALLEMGDFAGGLLKYLRRHPVPRLSIAGGFGKLSKLAAGHLDLHSSRSEVDTTMLGETLAGLGAAPEVADAATKARSAGEVLQIAGRNAAGLADAVAGRARAVAADAAGPDVAVEVLVFDRAGRLAGHARGW